MKYLEAKAAPSAAAAATSQRRLARPGHRPRLFNAYGPTETTMIVTIHEPRAIDGTEHHRGIEATGAWHAGAWTLRGGSP